MILNFFRSGDWTSAMIGVCVSIFVVFCTLPIHEYAHAWMSTRLGDDTARLSGRLTLNPLAHIDPIGAVMILLIGFGYAKPVPVNMRNFKNPKRDMALTALAGPVSNLLMALFFMVIYNIFGLFLSTRSTIISVALLFFKMAAMINVNLAVFNLLPIPPRELTLPSPFFYRDQALFAIVNDLPDWSRCSEIEAVAAISSALIILPDQLYYKVMQYERIIMLVVLALLFFGVLSWPLSFLSNLVMKGLAFVAGLPFLPFH